jgi:phosphoribosylamine--glycine ligase
MFLAEKVEMIVVGPEDPLVKESMTFFLNDEKVSHIQ